MRAALRLLLAVLACAPTLGAQAPRAAARHPVVLVSIDGLKPEYVLDADAHALRIPHLRALLARGAHAAGVIGVVPTVTYPSHTTLVTGASPARHGIFANTTFDPYNRNAAGWYWYASDIRVPTLWDAATSAGLTSANVHWPVTVGAHITWNLPQYWRTGEADDRKLVAALSSPGLYDSLEREVRIPYADGKDESIESDELRARFAARLIESRRPALTLAYFTALDHEQHTSGPFSAASLATLERIDAILGVIESAAARAYGRDAVIAVVSDHGFLPTSRAVHLASAFRGAGLVDAPDAAPDKPTAWRATVWPAGGSAAVMLHDSSAATLDTVSRLLRTLAAGDSSGIDRVIDRAELHRRGGFPGAAFLVSLKEGYTVGNDTHGPLMRPATVGGMHGYLPDLPAMRASFFMVGPGVPAGRDLGLIDQRAIAPTLARLLGVSLPTAEIGALFP
ncbi:MAG: ectonucleotide pyrophosphatase/phosphodiesterase [Gemmatimonadaceae bacterium]